LNKGDKGGDAEHAAQVSSKPELGEISLTDDSGAYFNNPCLEEHEECSWIREALKDSS